MINKELQEERIKHLAQMLKHMNGSSAKNILHELENDIKFDRALLNKLALLLFTPLKLFDELADDELLYIMENQDYSSIRRIISELDDNNRSRCRKIIGKDRYDEAVDGRSITPLLNVTGALLENLGTGISLGKIAYNGVALMLMTPPCRPENLLLDGPEIIFQTLNPVVSPGQGVKILIFSPGRPNINLRISLRKEGERFFNRDSWFQTIQLNETGLFLGDIYPMKTDGPVTLWLEIPGGGQVRRTVYYAARARSIFEICLLSADYNPQGRKTISFRIRGKKNISSEKKLRVTLYCSRCGLPVSSGMSNLKKDVASFEYLEPVLEMKHPHDYYMHVSSERHQGGVRINTGDLFNDDIPGDVEKNRSPADSVNIKLPVESFEKILYHCSTSLETDINLRNLISSGIIPLEGSGKDISGRKPSPVELTLLNDGMILLSERNDGIKSGIINYSSDTGFNYCKNSIENISNLYFTFYRITLNGIIPAFSFISLIKKEPFLFPEIPVFLEDDETVEVNLGYSLPPGGILNISGNGDGNGHELEGTGFLSTMVDAKKDIGLTWKCDGYENLIESINCTNLKREFSNTVIEYIPPGTVINAGGKTGLIELFGGPADLYKYFLEIQLLNYPWGCGEQTAAKIAGLCYKLADIVPVNSDNVYLMQVKSGLKHLLTFKNNDGYYSIFGNDFGPEPTRVLFGNIAPVLFLRDKLQSQLPDLFKLINDIKSRLNLSGEDISNIVTSQSIIMNQDDDGLTGPLNIISSVSSNLKLLNDKLVFLSRGFYSMPAYCCRLVESLLRRDINEINIFSNKEMVTRTVYRSGLIGFLEKLKLITPRTVANEKINTEILKNAIEYILTGISIGFVNGSCASTVEIISMIYLLSYLKKSTGNYSYRGGSGEFTINGMENYDSGFEVLSPFTFIKRNSNEIIWKNETIKPVIKIPSTTFKKGQVFEIKFSSSASAYEIYRFLLPAVLSAVESSNYLSHDQTVVLPSGGIDRVLFIAKGRGRGRLKLIVENMYYPSETFLMDLGMIEVL